MVTPLEAPSIVDVLTAALRERIFNCEIEPGAALTETGIAGDYKVARPTAKAAIEKLASEGLLHRDVHKTARVPSMTDPKVVRDLYFSRACIEREAMRQVADRDHTVPPAALAALEEISTAGETPSIGIVAPDIRFHQLLVDALGSPHLSKLYRSLMGEMRLCMAQVQSYKLLRPLEIAAEHQAILDRIRAGDPEGVADAVSYHLDHACEQLAKHLETHSNELNPPR